MVCPVTNRLDCLMVKIQKKSDQFDQFQEDEGAAAAAQPGQCQHRPVRGRGEQADSDREVQRQRSLLSGPPSQQGRCLGQKTQQLRSQLQRTGQSGDTATSHLLVLQN